MERAFCFAPLNEPRYHIAGWPATCGTAHTISSMADIKFHCPECAQKIAVDESAAGLQIDCPSCRSALLIPTEAGAPAQIITRRQQLATAGGSSSSAFAELER